MEHLEEFLTCQLSHKAPGTVRNYRRGLLALDAWLTTTGDATDLTATRADLHQFVASVRERPEANNFIAAVRVYFGWLAAEDLREDSPASGLRWIRGASKPVEPLSGEECQRIVGWAERAGKERFGGFRAAVMALFLLDTGARLGECLGLRMADVDLEEGKVVVRAPKTHSWRTVPLSRPICRWLRRYLARRARHFTSHHLRDDGWLWPAEHGGRLSVREAERGVEVIGAKTGITRLHAHLFRHSFATHTLANGGNLATLMKVGGWRRVETAMRYLQYSDAAVAEMMQQASPLAGLGRR